MEIINRLFQSLQQHSERPAFCMAGKFHTYGTLGEEISRLRSQIRLDVKPEENVVPVMVRDDLTTYAMMMALWMEGKGYLPLKPDAPEERNREILQRAGECRDITCNVSIAYLLFTSGSTGVPKGVPVTFGNLSAFIEAFEALGMPIDKEDRFLQMFDLTFDMSVISWVFPLLYGACVYTIPVGKIKYLYALRLMEEYQLTHAIMVPSIINYLRPYIEDIHLPAMRGILFAGEALYEEVIYPWRKCVPNALIFNSCGPTETTIVCTAYPCKPGDKLWPAHNGIITIGSEMKGTEIIIMDEENNPLPVGETGEICMAGEQLFPGYINDDERNHSLFFKYGGKRFFRTGDMAFRDKDRLLFFAGRKDDQVKIDGFRVELAEVEYHLKQIVSPRRVVVLSLLNEQKNNMLIAMIEGDTINVSEIKQQLRDTLPGYMIPSQFHFMPSFPQNANGKLDKRKITQCFLSC
ncbi:MAG: amino acid adenylation domain-containing protein [Bacteroidales bacterium]|jgi:acyl-coenzyme A synthetase/AMP-(fatty) acid ligase|nr:amino acid adenylation domain-containing protein [Bacteroidales bacterium]